MLPEVFNIKFTTLFVCLIILLPGKLSSQSVNHWETIVETGQTVSYLVPQSELPADWTSVDFDDSAWLSGIGGVGYGDDDDNTIIATSTVSVYVRYSFSITDVSAIETLLLDMDFDDSFVAYLNGTEIARVNLGAPGSTTFYDQFSDGLHEANLYNGEQPSRFTIDSTVLKELITGENSLCIEVHNDNINSSDLSSNAFLHAGINNANSYFNAVPFWFIEPLSYESELPIMVINTNGQTILNDPRIVAEMGLIYKGPDALNNATDSLNIYNGRITIEIRGSSSQMFPKKSYTFETQTDSGTNNNIQLLDLPRENDFVLNAPYSDKSLMRNVISYKVYEEMGRWAPKTKFINLYINEDFKGLYVLTEKVKQDKYRVDIKPLTELDVSSADISGGYILQIDRTNSLASNEYWTSPVSPPYSQFPSNTFEYYDPKREDLTAVQAAYIKNWTNTLDGVLASSNYKDPDIGYRKYIDVGSFVDYLIFHEFNKDVDAYRLSTFFYKASDLKGGKLHAGPPWDYNLTFGNMNYGGDILETYNWMYPKSAGRYWWPRLVYDPYFENEVFCRWKYLKETTLNKEHINFLIDSSISVMGLSIDQNFERWPVLGTYIWPNDYIGDTFEEEVVFLKNWISNRLRWLDLQWGDQCIVMETEPSIIQPLYSVSILPNPSDLSYTRIIVPDNVPGEYQLRIHDLNGREIYNQQYYIDQNSNEILLENLSYLESGIYLLKISGAGNISYTGKLIRE